MDKKLDSAPRLRVARGQREGQKLIDLRSFAGCSRSSVCLFVCICHWFLIVNSISSASIEREFPINAACGSICRPAPASRRDGLARSLAGSIDAPH